MYKAHDKVDDKVMHDSNQNTIFSYAELAHKGTVSLTEVSRSGTSY